MHFLCGTRFANKDQQFPARENWRKLLTQPNEKFTRFKMKNVQLRISIVILEAIAM